MNLITPAILIVLSLAVFFGYVNPTYQGDKGDSIVNLRAKMSGLNLATVNANQVSRDRNSKVQIESKISSDQRSRLVKMLPDNIDNVRLAVEMDKLARRYSLSGIKNVSLSNVEATDPNAIGATKETDYGEIVLKFTTNMTFENFLVFVGDLERNLRLVDITNITFQASDLSSNYDFNVTLKTYWLK